MDSNCVHAYQSLPTLDVVEARRAAAVGSVIVEDQRGRPLGNGPREVQPGDAQRVHLGVDRLDVALGRPGQRGSHLEVAGRG